MKELLKQLTTGQSLSSQQANLMMTEIMSGNINDALLAGLLVTLKLKGETVEELTAFASVMRKFVNAVSLNLDKPIVDIVGTGGDGLHTFNVSTTSTFVAAGAGVTIAKHGNRSASGLFGSADLLESIGINLTLTSSQVTQCVDMLGIGFMFASNHHPAMKHVKQVRQQLGIQTVFNLLGPLCNPSGAKHLVIGVFSNDWLLPLAEVLNNLGSQHVLLVNAHDGMDEFSCFSSNEVVELKNGKINHQTISPKDFGLDHKSSKDIVIKTPEDAQQIFIDVLNNTPGAALNMVLFNAGAAIYVAGIANTFKDGIALAKQSIESGAALKKYESLKQLSQNLC